MKMQIKKMVLDNFKGVSHGEYDFSKLTKVYGKNGTGKTTLADAFYFLFTDNNYALTNRPDIRPNDDHDCIPTVELILDVDGVEISAKKMQKKKTSKPDDTGVSKVTILNSYEVNSIPMTLRDFTAYFTERGVDLGKFIMLSHPEVFMSEKQDEMRKVLFSMASEKSDVDIAALLPETKKAAEMLTSYKISEIEAMEKASRKKAQDQLNSIPQQIIGLEKAKVSINLDELNQQKQEYKSLIDDIDKKINSKPESMSDLQSKLMKLQFEKNSLYADAHREMERKKTELEDKKYDLVRSSARISGSISGIEDQIEISQKTKERDTETLESLGADFHKNEDSKYSGDAFTFDESKWVFDESTTVCSLCGQTLPADKIESLKANFEARKAEEKARIEKENSDYHNRFLQRKKETHDSLIAKGNQLKAEIRETGERIEKLQSELSSYKSEAEKINSETESIEDQLKRITEPDMNNNQEYQHILNQMQDIESQIKDMQSHESDNSALESQKDGFVQQLKEIEKQLAQEDSNKRIDIQVEDMKRQITDYEQAKADAENILNQLDVISKKKNEMLTNEINQHFTKVGFKFFDYQKNGEYKEVCVPVIDGKEYGVSTNTGREIIAKLDIVYGLQRFFGQFVPVWLDNAESLNSENLLIDDNTQLITMNVSDDAALKVEV